MNNQLTYYLASNIIRGKPYDQRFTEIADIFFDIPLKEMARNEIFVLQKVSPNLNKLAECPHRRAFCSLVNFAISSLCKPFVKKMKDER